MILIDLSGLGNAALHIQEQDEFNSKDLIEVIINSIISTKLKFGGTYGDIVVAVDSKPYWRKQEFEHYKAHRVKAKEESPKDYNAFYATFNQLVEDMKRVLPYKVIEVPGAEADDVIGTLAAATQEKTLIHAVDGDFHQLLRNPVVKQFNPIQKKWVEDKPLKEIEWDLFFKIAKGDGGDGIPSCINPSDCIVNGVRQKPLRESTIRDWYENGIPEVHQKRFFENKKLIDLRETPEEIKKAIFEEYQKDVEGSKNKLMKWLTENNMRALVANLMEDMNRI